MLHRLISWTLLLALAGLTAGCDEQRAQQLEEGVATEADVRRQFGEIGRAHV